MKVIFWVVIAVILTIGFSQGGLHQPPPTPPKTVEQLEAERQELINVCFNAYGRMCRDETEAFFAGFRAGFNDGVSGNRSE